MSRPRSNFGAQLRAGASALLVVVLLVLVGASPAGADSLDELRERKQSAENKRAAAQDAIADLEAELEDTDKEMAAAYVRLQEIQAELPVAQAALEEAEGELDKARRAADDLSDRLEDAKADETELVERLEQDAITKDETRGSIAELARRAYRGEGNPDGVALIMGSESAQDFVTQFSLSQTALRTQSNSLTDLQQAEATSLNTQTRLEAVRDEITDLKAEADQAVLDAEDAAAEAEAHRTAVEDLVAEEEENAQIIESRREVQLADKEDQEAASDKLSNDILAIIGDTKAEKKRVKKAQAAQRRKNEIARKQAEAEAEAEAKKNNNTSKPKPKPNPPVRPKPPASRPPAPKPKPPSSSGSPSGRGYLNYATSPVHITSSYGWRMHPVLGYARLHAGTDFRAYCGTAIKASASGKVVGSSYRGGFGNQVLINHGTVNGSNLMTSYNHLSRYAVSSGQSVKQGQVIGYSGNTGTSSACHLHLEVYVNGATVNPMSML